jgi:hypothetical protein
MIAQPVLSKAELDEILEEHGCTDTREETETGTIWRAASGTHFTVPFPHQGYYPSWMLADIEQVVGKIDPWRKIRGEK